jgi:hypothetical protein
MFFKLGNGTAWLRFKWLSSIICILVASKVIAQEDKQTQLTAQLTPTSNIIFSAKPANCVALHQGRTCYATVAIQWQTPVKGNFCLYQKTTNKVLQCWQNSQGNQIQFEFESNVKHEYQLIAEETKRIIAETAVNVSWVHKATPRKRRWRLF